MRPSLLYLNTIAAQLTLCTTSLAAPLDDNTSISETNSTILLDDPDGPYPTSLANWTAPANLTLTDEERNPYWPHSDEFPIVNQSSTSSFVYNLTGLDVDQGNPKRTKRQDGKVLLRIMPLGASITQGLNADHSDQTLQGGYRQPLREWLRFNGWEVNYVGSKENGNFADNQNEGHPGYQIAAVQQAMDPVMTQQQPNLVLLNAGTNDCTQADDASLTPTPGLTWVKSIPDRLRTMIDLIYKESPGVTIILSTLLPNYTPGNAPSYVNVANQGIRQLYTEYAAKNAKMVLAEMDGGWFQYPADYSDVTHPNDLGYSMMASIWATAFEEVVSAGYLSEPNDTGYESGNSSGTCLPSESSFGPATETVQTDIGYNDGTYSHSSELLLQDVLSIKGYHNKSMLGYHQFHFAQLVAVDDADYPRDEFIMILDPADRAFMKSKKADSSFSNYMQYRYNYGDGEFGDWEPVDIIGQGTPECLSRGVRFGDINGDGLDDFICINKEGSPFVSLNRGGSPPKFEYIGQIYSDRFAQANVRLADIDGDGRLDYCGMDPSGDVYCHRNGGTGDAPIKKYGGYWQGILLSGGGPTWDSLSTDIAGVRFLDINGDGRDDYVFVRDDGSTTIYINQRGDKDDGPGLKPHWEQASVSHLGFPGDTDINRDNILFGRIYGTGRQDYIRVDETKSGKTYGYSFSFWNNTGSGGRKLNGDGIHFCDMTGSGTDDMIYIWEGGMIDVWFRGGTDDSPTWTSHGRIANLAVDRKFMHVIDWDGDGRCDIMHVDKSTGDVTWWQNYQLQADIRPHIGAPLSAVTGGRCPQTFSPGLTDLAVRFGDLDGDGKADYLCMDPDGRTVAWLNKGLSGLTPLNQVKVSVGFDRPNHRWADVNGDGLVDFIWVDKHTGNVQFWENNGFIPSIGSSMNWIGYSSSWISGKERGENIQFPKMRAGSKRVDYHIVHPRNGRGTTYFNSNCGDGGVGPGPDDGAGAVDPQLPDNPNGGTTPSPICPRAATKCGSWPDYPDFIALGDSYGAGIGAGTRITDNTWDTQHACFQGTNANSRYLFYQTGDLRNKNFDFLACTGDTCSEITSDSSGGRGKSQLGYVSEISNENYAVMTLSIGGNDVKFADIAIWCLIVPTPVGTKCENLMQFAEKSVAAGQYSGQTSSQEYQDLYNKLLSTYRAVLKMPATSDNWLLIYGYGRFFNDADQSSTPGEDCAALSLSLVALGPTLDVDKRSRINAAIVAMNTLIKTAIAQVKGEFPRSKIRFVDIDPLLEGHRWCDKDENGQLKTFGDAWMFLPEGRDIVVDPSTGIPTVSPRDPDTGGPTWGEASWDCSIEPLDMEEEQSWYCALKAAEDSGDFDCDAYPEYCGETSKRDVQTRQLGGITEAPKYHTMKGFHPKSVVHIKAAEYVQLNYNDWQLDPDGCPCAP
ncbi:Glucan endo-1,3-alpha-glucosidase agn1 [Paraconiothyrium brasiliense]|uniref:Glucan endo-1,3-alpha-glucosidase agn1 n=1 Tax=Paraconiothyrium brasiliense TaxID=300254 RepID=A0ABR3R4T8_9PLEO